MQRVWSVPNVLRESAYLIFQNYSVFLLTRFIKTIHLLRPDRSSSPSLLVPTVATGHAQITKGGAYAIRKTPVQKSRLAVSVLVLRLRRRASGHRPRQIGKSSSQPAQQLVRAIVGNCDGYGCNDFDTRLCAQRLVADEYSCHSAWRRIRQSPCCVPVCK